jgi:hypothetical protein
MTKDVEDILREIKAESSGISPKDVQFNDLRKKKKKKKKKKIVIESESKSDIIDNNEGFAISGLETEFCSYADIGKKGKLREKNSLEEWGPFDFFQFANKLYVKKYKESWDLNIGGNSIEINRIRDKFYDIFGFCCNLIMRDYIVFFFNNHIDDFKREQGEFYFSQMRQDYILLSFAENYNFKERFVNYMNREKQKNKKFGLTKEEIKTSFDMGDFTLLANYGVVISLNWLLRIKKMSKKEAVKLIVDACNDIHKKGMIDIVKSSTEVYSPYPSNLLFKSPQLVFNKIDKRIQLKVEFTDNDKMKFLQKENNKKH